MIALRHVLSAKDFSYISFLEIFRITAQIKDLYKTVSTRSSLKYLLLRDGRPLHFRILTSAPSTRTIANFEDAVGALGGKSSLQMLQFSSMAKGETYRSTARILAPRSDCIVIRDDHNENAAKEMAEAVNEYGFPTVIINAGNGSKEHPVQMLTDLYTIWELDRKKFESGKLVYAIVGDLSHSRTIHSSLAGLTLFGGKVYLVGPAYENIPEWLEKEISNKDQLKVIKTEDPLAIAPEVDYWYFTRLQSNLRPEPLSLQQVEGYKKYAATEELRRIMKENARVLHPLPFGNEYEERIDLADARFIHYYQADNGLFIPMTLAKLFFAPSLDLRKIVQDHENTEASGHFECVEIPIVSIHTVCCTVNCPFVRVDKNNWVKIDPVVKERLLKPRTPCPHCRPM